MKTINLYNVKIYLLNDIVTNGKHYSETLTLDFTILARSKKESIVKAVNTVPEELENTIIKTAMHSSLLLDGNVNEQLIGILKGNIKTETK